MFRIDRVQTPRLSAAYLYTSCYPLSFLLIEHPAKMSSVSPSKLNQLYHDLHKQSMQYSPIQISPNIPTYLQPFKPSNHLILYTCWACWECCMAWEQGLPDRLKKREVKTAQAASTNKHLCFVLQFSWKTAADCVVSGHNNQNNT